MLPMTNDMKKLLLLMRKITMTMVFSEEQRRRPTKTWGSLGWVGDTVCRFSKDFHKPIITSLSRSPPLADPLRGAPVEKAAVGGAGDPADKVSNFLKTNYFP